MRVVSLKNNYMFCKEWSMIQGNSLAVQCLGLGAFTAQTRVWSLVRELGSHKPCGVAKKKYCNNQEGYVVRLLFKSLNVLRVKDTKTTNCKGSILGMVYTKRTMRKFRQWLLGYISEFDTLTYTCMFEV